MDGSTLAAFIAALALLGAGIGVWVSLRERLVRAETRLEILERDHERHKVDIKSDFMLLREWLEAQFHDLRKTLERKADR